MASHLADLGVDLDIGLGRDVAMAALAVPAKDEPVIAAR